MDAMGNRNWARAGIERLAFAAVIGLLAFIIAGKARAQETATYQRVMAAQEAWQGAIVIPSAWDSGKSAKAASEPAVRRQSPIQRVVEGASFCFIAWHAQPRRNKPEAWKIECRGG